MKHLIFSYLMMLLVFLSYVVSIAIIYGIQRSISNSYYKLPSKYNFLFVLFCWGFSFPAIIIGVELTNNFLMFLAGAGIGFVGAAAAFKEKMTNSVHMTGAYSAVALSQLSIFYDFHLYYINVIFIVGALLMEILSYYNKLKNKIWWQEILAFISIIITYTIKLFF